MKRKKPVVLQTDFKIKKKINVLLNGSSGVDSLKRICCIVVIMVWIIGCFQFEMKYYFF